MTSTAASSPRLIVGFSGYLRSGKDTAGSALAADGFHHASFAAKLKAFVYALNPIVPHTGIDYRLATLVDAYGWERCKDRYPEVRTLLQRCGTDAGRRVLGEDVWVDAVMSDLPAEQDVVFTDCRFPNEARAIQAAGGFVIRVNRPGYEPGPDAHESETSLDGYPFDFTIVNGRTVEALHAQVRSLMVTCRSAAAAEAIPQPAT